MYCSLRPDRGTPDQLLIIRQVMEKFWEHDVDINLLIIDFKEAFDSINRKDLFKILREIGIAQN